MDEDKGYFGYTQQQEKLSKEEDVQELKGEQVPEALEVKQTSILGTLMRARSQEDDFVRLVENLHRQITKFKDHGDQHCHYVNQMYSSRPPAMDWKMH